MTDYTHWLVDGFLRVTSRQRSRFCPRRVSRTFRGFGPSLSPEHTQRFPRTPRSFCSRATDHACCRDALPSAVYAARAIMVLSSGRRVAVLRAPCERLLRRTEMGACIDVIPLVSLNRLSEPVLARFHP